MIGVYIRPSEMTEEQYHEINERIGAAGIGQAGLLVHTCFSEGEQLAIFDVWESEEAFRGFAAQLGGLLAAGGIPALQPMIVSMIDLQIP